MGELLGAYRLKALAGEGSMGRVFRAVHERIGRTVALKLLRRRYASRSAAVARFLDEARAASRLRHPHLVEVTDFHDGWPGGDSYYIMEWLEGVDLATLLQQSGTLPSSDVIRYGRQLASALAAIHEAGLIHRDIKPDNIYLIERDGQPMVKLLDLGLALPPGASFEEGTLAGTPAYFAPEVAAGRPVDGRADLYSLGVVLYELLTGAPPFHGETLAEYAMKHMTAPHRPVAESVHTPVPRALAQIIDRCLQKDPARRFQSMTELMHALEAVEHSKPGKLVCRLQQGWRRRAPCLAAGVASLTLLAGLVWLGRQADVPLPTTPAPAVHAASAPPLSLAAAARLPVEVVSEPPGAEVMRDGMTLGTTPCRVRLPHGTSTLEIHLSGYHPVARPIDPAQEPRLSLVLEPLEQHASRPLKP